MVRAIFVKIGVEMCRYTMIAITSDWTRYICGIEFPLLYNQITWFALPFKIKRNNMMTIFPLFWNQTGSMYRNTMIATTGNVSIYHDCNDRWKRVDFSDRFCRATGRVGHVEDLQRSGAQLCEGLVLLGIIPLPAPETQRTSRPYCTEGFLRAPSICPTLHREA